MIKKLLFFITPLLCLINFNSCRFDRIDHTDENYIYVWEYAINGDSTLCRYNKPITYQTVVTNKRRHGRFIGIPGKGGHYRTDQYISYRINGKEVEDVVYGDIYYKVEKGTIIVVREEFYPRYNRVIIEVY